MAAPIARSPIALDFRDSTRSSRVAELSFLSVETVPGPLRASTSLSRGRIDEAHHNHGTLRRSILRWQHGGRSNDADWRMAGRGHYRKRFAYPVYRYRAGYGFFRQSALQLDLRKCDAQPLGSGPAAARPCVRASYRIVRTVQRECRNLRTCRHNSNCAPPRRRSWRTVRFGRSDEVRIRPGWRQIDPYVD